MIGISGLPLVNQPHGLEPVHARHENIEEQEVEASLLECRKPFAAVTGDDHAVPGALQQEPDRHLHRSIVVND